MYLTEDTLLFMQGLVSQMTVTCIDPDAENQIRLVQKLNRQLQGELRAVQAHTNLSRPPIPGGQPVEFKLNGPAISQDQQGRG